MTELGIHQRAMMIGRSFQVPRLVADMSVLQNVVIRADQLFPKWTRERTAWQSPAVNWTVSVWRTLQANGLARSRSVSTNLSTLRGLLWESPQLVLLDEPAVGLSSEELDRLRSIIRTLKDSGSAVVVVDHNVDFILSIADRILVMESGASIAVGPGGGSDRRSSCAHGLHGCAHMTNTLTIERLSGGYGKLCVFRDVEFAVAQGETVGHLRPQRRRQDDTTFYRGRVVAVAGRPCRRQWRGPDRDRQLTSVRARVSALLPKAGRC